MVALPWDEGVRLFILFGATFCFTEVSLALVVIKVSSEPLTTL